jgi:hypothetical protein
MKHNFRHKHSQNKDSHKILLNIDKNHRLVTKVKIDSGHLVEIGGIFLVMDEGHIQRTVYTMERILEYSKKSLSHNKYLEVEKFFMERNT